MEPAEALDAIAFLLERSQAEVYRVRAYRNAARALRLAGPEAVARLAAQGRLTDLKQVGSKTAAIATEVLATGEAPQYLRDLREASAAPARAGERRWWPRCAGTATCIATGRMGVRHRR